jgi:hypothetical protein
MEIHRRRHRRAITHRHHDVGNTIVVQRTHRAEVLDLADLGRETTLVGALVRAHWNRSLSRSQPSGSEVRVLHLFPSVSANMILLGFEFHRFDNMNLDLCVYNR